MLQLRRELAALPYQEQLRRLQPPRPFNSLSPADASAPAVQMIPDPPETTPEGEAFWHGLGHVLDALRNPDLSDKDVVNRVHELFALTEPLRLGGEGMDLDNAVADLASEMLQLISARPAVSAEFGTADLRALFEKFPETCLAVTARELAEGGRVGDAAAEQPHHTLVEVSDGLRSRAEEVFVVSDETLMAVMADLGSGSAAGGETHVVQATDGTVAAMAALQISIGEETAALAEAALGVSWEQIAAGLGWDEMEAPTSDARTRGNTDSRNRATRTQNVEIRAVVDASGDGAPTALLAFLDVSTDGEAFRVTRPFLEDTVPRALPTRLRVAIAYEVVESSPQRTEVAFVSAAVVVDSESGRHVAQGGDLNEVVSQLQE